MIVLDSCRYDSLIRAKTPNLDKIGPTQRRWSYASWTVPSHHAFLMGLVPHQSPQREYASETYKKDFVNWIDRLGVSEIDFESFLPHLSLPKVLKERGYRCVARVSMPVLNGYTLINKFFDDYKLMTSHNDFIGIVEEIQFLSEQPTFFFLNLGETHYPYMLEGDDLPHISGVHGVCRDLAAGQDGGATVKGVSGMSCDDIFNSNVMRRLREQQVNCVEYVDSLIERIFDKAPANTYFMVMSDHGEAFGEGGYFGHGPVMHEKVFEVPFLEGRRP